jgi:hypothetical protein
MAFHLEVVRERAQRAYAETLDAATSIQVYGPPTETILDLLSRSAGPAVSLTLKPHHLGGFTRS